MNNYIVATLTPWHHKVFHEVIRHYEGNWYLFSNPSRLTVRKIKEINPKYIFFPHWSEIVPDKILNIAECVCFHPAPVPKGRGSSLIQHLIQSGASETTMTALKMVHDIDAGPIYLQKSLSLNGLAEEIYLRSAYVIAEMIRIMIDTEIEPTPQAHFGEPTYFKRRTPDMSEIKNINTLDKLFDHIRMLDAETYPRAYLEADNLRFEFTRPARKTDCIEATVKITEKEKHEFKST